MAESSPLTPISRHCWPTIISRNRLWCCFGASVIGAPLRRLGYFLRTLMPLRTISNEEP